MTRECSRAEEGVSSTRVIKDPTGVVSGREVSFATSEKDMDVEDSRTSRTYGRKKLYLLCFRNICTRQ